MKLKELHIGDIVRARLCDEWVISKINGIHEDIFFSGKSVVTFDGRAFFNYPRNIMPATPEEIFLYKLENH